MTVPSQRVVLFGGGLPPFSEAEMADQRFEGQ
jgi:hypothetical protein